MRRVARRADGCSVLIREGAIGSSAPEGTPFHWFVLRNQQRGEAVLGDQSEPLSNRELQFGTSFQLFLPWLRAEFAFKDHIDMFPSGRGSDVPSPIDAAWLDGADLLVIERAYAGRLTRSFTVDGFTMRR